MSSERDIEALLVHDVFVRGLARQLVRDHAAAEDLAQEAWLAALSSRARLASFPRWAGAALRNLARNVHRAERRRGAREAATARPEGVPSAEEVLAREALRAEVVAAVLALEEPLRGTLLLRFFDGLPPRAIARRQGVPVETVRTHLKRGLARLRARLEREHGSAWAALVVPLARGARPSGLARITEAASASTLGTVAVMSTLGKIGGAVVGAVLVVVVALQLRGRERTDDAEAPRAESAVVLRDPGRVEEALAVAPVPAGAERAAVPAASEEAAEEPLVVEERGSVLVRVKWHDGTPAEGIGVRVQERWTSGSASVRDRVTRTDELGEARIGGLATGAAYVQLDRGDVQVGDTVAIEDGAESSLELVLRRGFDVNGLVLDPLGAPVADAAITYAPSHLDEGEVVARTDGGGRFHVRALGGAGGHVWATARGFAPSLAKQVGAGEGVAVDVELVLIGPGGAVTGVVVDPDGEPVVGAWVLAGLDHELGVVERVPIGGVRAERGVLPGASIVRTEADGRYLVEGLAPGRRRLAVRAPGFGAHRAEVEIVADVTQVHDVVLTAGVTVIGRVTKDDGTPATRASVEVGSWTVLHSEAHMDSRGSFRLEGLEAGEIELSVTSFRDGDARVTLHGAPGEMLTCDVQLVPKEAVRGRVVDERGEPLVGWHLQLRDEPTVPEDPDFSAATTDAEGRFEMADLHDRTHRVELRHPEHRVPVLEVSGVRPGAEELELVVLDAALPTVHVRGRVVDELGAPLPTARVAFGRDAAGVMRGATVDERGEFSIGPIPSGTWTLRVHGQGFGPAAVVVGPRELLAEEVWECGDVVVRVGE